MSKLKLETIILPKKTQVLITNTRLPISLETVKQLTNYTHIEVLTTASGDSEFPDITSLGVIVHFAGFENQSLSETLSYTAVVYRLLQLSKSYASQFILVLPNTRNHLYYAALSLVTQFSKNFPLNYQVIEIDPKSDYLETAYEIVKKFIHRHPRPVLTPKPQPVTPKVERPRAIKPPLPKLSYKFKLPELPKLPSLNKRKAGLISLGLSGIIAIPVLIYFLCILVVGVSVSCVGKSLSKTNFRSARHCSQLGFYSSNLLVIYNRYLPVTNNINSSLGFPSVEVSQFFNSTTTVTKQFTQLQVLSKTFVTNFINNTNNKGFPSDITPILNSLSESLASLQTEIRSWYTATPNPSPKITTLAEELNSVKILISKLQGMSEDWPNLLGIIQKQTYLVLIQDNTEAKPSGGFIDSLLLLSVENGNLVNTELLTSQSADSQLNGQVEPPPDFKALTGASLWYLRDSNWDPDFPVSARRAAWFASKELNRPIDGVIAINQNTLIEFLKILGPVKVDSTQTQISSKNLTDVYLSNLNVSSQSILYEVTSKIIEKIKDLDSSHLDSLTLALLSQLESREILIYPTTFSSLGLESAGWSGGLGLSGCRSQLPCISDYVFATDTNIGVNKADFYVNKTQETEINIETDKILSVHSFNYQNTSAQSIWPAGDYKNYFRIYLPQTAKITSIAIDGSEMAASDYFLTSQNGLQLLGISLKVAVSLSANLVIKTETPTSVNQKTHYQLDMPNQSGLRLSSRKLSITYPKSWFTTVYSSTADVTPSVASPGLLRYNAPTSKPLIIDLDIAASN